MENTTQIFVEVVIGDYNLATNPDCPTHLQCKPVQKFSMLQSDVIIHEEWNLARLKEDGNDIALIRLPKIAYTMFEIGSGVHVAPICLPWGRLPDGNNAVYPSSKTQVYIYYINLFTDR